MVKSIYAVFDRKTNSVELVQMSANLEAFERWFAHIFLWNNSDSMFALYPEDYDIYNLFTFDTESLEGETSWKPHLVANVASIFDHFHIARPNLARDPDEA